MFGITVNPWYWKKYQCSFNPSINSFIMAFMSRVELNCNNSTSLTLYLVYIAHVRYHAINPGSPWIYYDTANFVLTDMYLYIQITRPCFQQRRKFCAYHLKSAKCMYIMYYCIIIFHFIHFSLSISCFSYCYFFYHVSVSLFGCKISLSKCNITWAHKPSQVSCSLCAYYCFHLNDPYLCFFVSIPVSHLGWPRSISMI